MVVLGVEKCWIVVIFLGSSWDSAIFTICPRNIIFLDPKQHLLGFNLRWTPFNFWRTSQMWHKCSFQVPLCMLTSSINIFTNWLIHSLNMLAMVHKNVLVAFFSLNGITFHSYKPDLVITPIFLTPLGAIRISQNLDCKSSTENHLECLN